MLKIIFIINSNKHKSFGIKWLSEVDPLLLLKTPNCIIVYSIPCLLSFSRKLVLLIFR